MENQCHDMTHAGEGNPVLLSGDCMEHMTEMHAGSVNLVLADLPYGTTSCAWDTPLDLPVLWRHYARLLAPEGCVVLTASQPFTSVLVTSNLKWFRCEWIWEKNAGSNFGMVRWQPMKEHESVLVFSQGKHTYNPIMEERAPSGAARVKTVVNYDTATSVYQGGLDKKVSSMRPTLRYPRSIQRFNRQRGLHPTQKPLDLMSYLVRTYSNPGDMVLDNTMGSGTTGVAALAAGRKFTGIELREDHFLTACNRIRERSMQTSLHV